MAWADKIQARRHWADALNIDDAVLDELLAAAYPSCYAYAPALNDRTLTDAVTTLDSNMVTSASGAFSQAEVGRTVSGAGIPASTTIMAVASTTVIALSQNATASGIDVSLTIDGIPTNYVLANIFQAREIYAAAQRGEQDVIGVGDYAIRARPLTAAVKQLLRPQRGFMAVG